MTIVLNTADCHSWHIHVLHLTLLIITLDTTDCHTRHITGSNNAAKPPRYWWSYTTTWMTVGSDHHIQVWYISTPSFQLQKVQSRSPSGVTKWDLWVSHAKWVYQMLGSHHSLIPPGSSNFSAHHTLVYCVNHPFLNIKPHHLTNGT